MRPLRVGLLRLYVARFRRVVRRAWPEFSKSGYGLTNVAAHFGIEYRAHDALEDARCAGELLLRAIDETGLSPEQWLVRVEQPIDPNAAHGPSVTVIRMGSYATKFSCLLGLCRFLAMRQRMQPQRQDAE